MKSVEMELRGNVIAEVKLIRNGGQYAQDNKEAVVAFYAKCRTVKHCDYEYIDVYCHDLSSFDYELDDVEPVDNKEFAEFTIKGDVKENDGTWEIKKILQVLKEELDEEYI